jgi:two-component system, sensor histidine kinase and response regulator
MTKTKKEKILDERIQILKSTHIFSETGADVLFEIANALTEKHARKEKIIIHKGDLGNSMYIMVKGKVRVHDGNHVLTKLGPGSVFGEYSLIDEETRSASVTADEPSDLLKLSQEDFYGVISEKKEIMKGVLRVLVKRMRNMNILEEKLSKSYLKIQKQKDEIELQHQSILKQKELLEEQNYDLLNLNEEKNHLLSVVVHGIKNPLTSSLCMIDLLKEDPKTDESQLEYTAIIENSLNRINKMINEILNINRIESKTLSLKTETIEMSKLIKEVLLNFNMIVVRKSLQLNLNLDKCHAKLNEVYTHQIVDNLLSNAFRFSPISKSIDINLTANGENIRLEIIDEGPGISKNDPNSVFKIYQRQNKDPNKDNASVGLGLAIVKRYANAMKGKVWCENTKDKGAKFIVELPQLNPDFV